MKSQKYVLSNQDLKATVTKMAIQVYLQFQKTNILPNHYINLRLCEWETNRQGKKDNEKISYFCQQMPCI